LDIDDLLIQAFLVGATIGSAANHAHCGERTVYRRLRDHRFKQRLAEARANVVQRVSDRISWHAVAAVDRLAQLVDSSDNEVALRAIALLLGHTARLRELEQFEARLVALEAAAPPPPPARTRRVG
jgi:hypothetical protein